MGPTQDFAMPTHTPPVFVDRWSEHVWAEVGRQDADGVRKIATILRQTANGLDDFAREAVLA